MESLFSTSNNTLMYWLFESNGIGLVLRHIKDDDCKLDTIEKMQDFLDDAESISKHDFDDLYNEYTGESKVVVVDCTGDNWSRIHVYERECIRFDDHYNGDFKVFLVAIKED